METNGFTKFMAFQHVPPSCDPLMQHIGSERPCDLNRGRLSADETLPLERLDATDETLMWESFTAQPSLEWFDLDL